MLQPKGFGANLDLDGRQAVRNINELQTILGTNVSGAAAAISATTRLMALDVGAIIGDISSEFTAAEAIMTSSVGIPQCSFATYNLDVTQLSARAYLLRTVPGVLTYFEAIFQVIMHFNWKRISILYTSDLPGLLEIVCGTVRQEYRYMKAAIPIPDDETNIVAEARGAIRTIQKSDTRIHVLIASRATQVAILDTIRDHGLFDESHVWLTTVDLSDSIAQLDNPTDFNGLIMTDALWEMPGVPAFDNFVNNWMNLDPKRYPHPVTTQLTWHQTFAYACLQVIAEGYRGLVQEAYKTTNTTLRDQTIYEIKSGKRSHDLTLSYLASRVYDAPIGNFSITKNGEPMPVRISIMSFQDYTSVPNGRIIDNTVSLFNPIKFKNGETNVPYDSPSWDELNPQRDSGFGLAMTIVSSILMLAIFLTAAIVLLNRDNIIVKSARVFAGQD
ncbi:hypothetical protein BGX26_012463 [Mortierella sp. AD094]|nr:hypothetical protein BGX26_012463 [Mortierella sp. AD094]